ncbi:MAG: MMPL family transporter [Candidatus Nanopelagicales bacterium]|nr:MMPL family transporter [Candidatus Nanopelagicales bacterium]
MFENIGQFVVRHRKGVFVGYLISVLIAGVIGAGVFGSLKSQGYDDLGSDSAEVERLLKSDFDTRDASAILVIDTFASIDDQQSVAAANELLAQVADEENIESIVSYWNTNQKTLKSFDGNAGLALVYFAKDLDSEQAASTAKNIQDTYDKESAGTRAYVGGIEVLYEAINGQIENDLKIAEAIAIPLNVLMLLFVFGAAVAAGLPMVVALGSIAGSFFVLYLVTQFTDVSVFALNLITGLGLGLGIDYALLIVNRFREELARTNDVDASVVTTVSTAGRTVFYSGITVALVLASMLLFPQYFLKSFAYAGVSVVLFAVLASLIALPATLALLGHKVDKWKIRRGDLKPKESGAWSTLATAVMKRPILIIVGTVALLVALASPALDAKFSQVDDRVLPASNPAAIASDQIRERFESQIPVEVLVPISASTAEVNDYAKALVADPNVISALTSDSFFEEDTAVPVAPEQAVTPSQAHHRITLYTNVESRNMDAQNLVTRLRAIEPPAEGTLVGGQAAIFTDSQNGISENLPAVLGWLIIATLIILFLFTGSAVLPIKAVILNMLSLGATLGVLVWVFQDGNAMWLVGDFTVTGALDTSTLVLVAIVAFGLSMDYELFLLSRIKEEHENGADTITSVSLGLQKSGRIITAAAVLIAIVFACFMTSGVTSIKMLGLGIAFAILLDATIVRGLLVPALMRVAGDWNWWAPKSLQKLHSRFGISD